MPCPTSPRPSRNAEPIALGLDTAPSYTVLHLYGSRLLPQCIVLPVSNATRTHLISLSMCSKAPNLAGIIRSGSLRAEWVRFTGGTPGDVPRAVDSSGSSGNCRQAAGPGCEPPQKVPVKASRVAASQGPPVALNRSGRATIPGIPYFELSEFSYLCARFVGRYDTSEASAISA